MITSAAFENAIRNPLAFVLIQLYINKMESKPTGRGGPGRGQGRKPLKEGQESMIVPIRMTAEQKEKLARLGGAKWIRDRIDKAKEPEQK